MPWLTPHGSRLKSPAGPLRDLPPSGGRKKLPSDVANSGDIPLKLQHGLTSRISPFIEGDKSYMPSSTAAVHFPCRPAKTMEISPSKRVLTYQLLLRESRPMARLRVLRSGCNFDCGGALCLVSGRNFWFADAVTKLAHVISCSSNPRSPLETMPLLI
jgi:hypothetical protein